MPMVPDVYIRSEIRFPSRKIIAHSSIAPDIIFFTFTEAETVSRILEFQKCKVNLGMGTKALSTALNTFFNRAVL